MSLSLLKCHFWRYAGKLSELVYKKTPWPVESRIECQDAQRRAVGLQHLGGKAFANVFVFVVPDLFKRLYFAALEKFPRPSVFPRGQVAYFVQPFGFIRTDQRERCGCVADNGGLVPLAFRETRGTLYFHSMAA